ncbi:MAG: helix-turn-helix domain-containing protein [Dehalococcoidia bacterium]
MGTDYATVITEALPTLQAAERRVRGRPTAVRVQGLRLLKGGAARSLEACARLVGHSPRQVARWWALYRAEGLAGLLREPTYPGKTPRLTPAALADLETAMAAGQIATLKDAQAYLAGRHGIVYRSLNGVWAQLRKHKIKLKTGRRQHDLADAEEQAAFRAGFRGEAGRARAAAGLGLR